MDLDTAIKEELKNLSRFPESKKELLDQDKLGPMKVGTKIVSRFIIDGNNNDNPLGEYAYSNESIKSKPVELLVFPESMEGDKDYEYLWMHRVNSFLARAARMQDMFGGILNWPRTAYVPSNRHTRGAITEPLDASEIKESKNNLYPEDVDQIIYCAHLYDSDMGEKAKPLLDVLVIGICRIRKMNVDPTSPFITVKSIRIFMYDTILDKTSDENKIKEIEDKISSIEKEIIPAYVFGPNWVFGSSFDNVNIWPEKRTPGFSDAMIKHFLHPIIDLSQNWKNNEVFNNYHRDYNLKKYAPYVNILASFQLPIIPFVVPSDKDQMKERRPSGRWTPARALAILDPSNLPSEKRRSVMAVKDPYSTSVKCIRIPLHVYDRRKQ